MDVQADAAEVVIPDPDQREARHGPRALPRRTWSVAAALLPGGEAAGHRRRRRRHAGRRAGRADGARGTLGAAVVTTWNGKGAIDETHPLAALTIGDTASSSGNELAASADVILSVGNRFTDWSASSWRRA